MQLSCLANLASQDGHGHKCFLSPVWILLCLAKWPEVVNTLAQVLQTCFLFSSGDEARMDPSDEVEEFVEEIEGIFKEIVEDELIDVSDDTEETEFLFLLND